MRQVQQLAQALAAILFNKKERRPELAEDHMTRALRDVFDRDLEQLQEMSRAELIDLCSPGTTWSPDLALGLADLLGENDAQESRERAAWLYEAALDAGDIVPLDVFGRIESLKDAAG